MRLLQKLRTVKRGTTRRKAISRAAIEINVLEPRLLLSAVNMADEEQLMLEFINRARANPADEATRYGISLNQGLPSNTISSTPKQPLAPNQTLVNIAVSHSLDMINRDFFDHVNPNLQDPDDRATAAGYNWQGLAENIASLSYTATPNSATQVNGSHQILFENPLYRTNMLLPDLEETGIGIRNGDFTPAAGNATLTTEDFGRRNLSPYITGVVYRDSNGSDFYDIGEAIRAGTVRATNVRTGAVFSETIGISGGYGIIVPAGSYSVTAQYTVGGVAQKSTRLVTVSADNGKVDFDATNPTSVFVSLSSGDTSLNETGASTTTSFTVTRTGDTNFSLMVDLMSSDISEAVVPTSITIPVGQKTVQFTVTSVNDLVIDGTQTAQITATAFGYESGSLSVSVSDMNSPLLPSGEHVVTTARPTFSWTSVLNAATYEIWINNVSTGVDRIVNESGIRGTSFTPSIDLPIGTFNVWVRGITSSGLAGIWSPVGVWKVRPTTTVLGSWRTERSSTFDIAWTPIAGASSYDIWINRLTSQTSEYFRNTSVPGSSITVSNFAIGLYSVWVRGQNSRGEMVGWSAPAIINVNLPVIDVRVAATDLTAAATLNWNAVDGATRYDVWIDNLTTRVAQFVRNVSVAGTSLSLPTLTQGSYRAWVRAKDVKGVTNSWSRSFDFEFQRASRMLTPPSSAQVPRPLFSWTAVSGATRYELIVADGDSNHVITQGLAETSFTPFANLAAGAYRAWVKAFDASGSSIQSGFISFSVADAAPSGLLKLESGEVDLVFTSIDQLLTNDDDLTVDDSHSSPRPATAMAEDQFVQKSGDIIVASEMPHDSVVRFLTQWIMKQTAQDA